MRKKLMCLKIKLVGRCFHTNERTFPFHSRVCRSKIYIQGDLWDLVKRKVRKTSFFLLFCFSLSYTSAVLFYIMGGRLQDSSALIFLVFYMFIPTISAVTVLKVFGELKGDSLGISFRFNKWFIVGWLLPVLIVFASLGLSSLLPGVEYSPSMEGLLERFKGIIPEDAVKELEASLKDLPIPAILFALLTGLASGISINSVVALGEEIGWRGFLYRELGSLGFWKSSLSIGLIWGVWHTPIILQGFNYPQHPVEGVLLMTLFCILLSPIFNFIRFKSGSVLAAAIFHGTLNGVGGISIAFIKGGSDITVGVNGIIGLTFLAIMDVIMYLMDKTRKIIVNNS